MGKKRQQLRITEAIILVFCSQGTREDFNCRSLTTTNVAPPEGHVILKAEQILRALYLVSMMQQCILSVKSFW